MPSLHVMRPSTSDFVRPASSSASAIASTAMSDASRPGSSPCGVAPTPTMAALAAELIGSRLPCLCRRFGRRGQDAVDDEVPHPGDAFDGGLAIERQTVDEPQLVDALGHRREQDDVDLDLLGGSTIAGRETSSDRSIAILTHALVEVAVLQVAELALDRFCLRPRDHERAPSVEDLEVPVEPRLQSFDAVPMVRDRFTQVGGGA